MLLETPPSLLFFGDFWVPVCPSALQVFFFCSVLACLFLSLLHHIDPYDRLICLLYSSLHGLQREPSALRDAARTSTGSDLLISNSHLPVSVCSNFIFPPIWRVGCCTVTLAPQNKMLEICFILRLPQLTPHWSQGYKFWSKFDEILFEIF